MTLCFPTHAPILIPNQRADENKMENPRASLLGAMILLLAMSLSAHGGKAVKSAKIEEYSVASPDGKILVTVAVGEKIAYSVSSHGQPVVLPSAFRLEFKDAPALGGDCRVRSHSVLPVKSEWENRLGKRRHVVENGNEMRLVLDERQVPKRRLELVLRAYNDGIAFRYVLPTQAGLREFTLTREEMQFRFGGDPVVWAANYGGYSSAQEGEFRKQKMSALSSETPYGVPLLLRTEFASYVAITEADLQDWAGMYLSGTSTANEGVRLFDSGVMRGGEAAKRLTVPLTGRQTLRLIVGDGGDDFTFDHADWADAKLTTTDGKTVFLSSLTPVSSVQGFGTLGHDKSVDGNPLKIGERSFAHGLGSHSKGEIVYDLSGKYTRLEAEVGIDAETKTKGSATFTVFTDDGTKRTESGLVTRLAPRHDGQGLVKSVTPCKSPWRVLLIGARPGDLVESDMVLNLSEPSAIGDAQWVQPGKCAWDHWWSGDVKMDTATEKEYIEFAAEMGFPYQLVDWQWYGPFNTADADISHINPNLDMPEVLRFAREKKVRLFVWLHSNDVDRKLRAGQLDTVFALYEKWGLAGVKIDFMDRDDQEMVNWYHTVIKAAAAHHLMVDFHGAYKPTGTQRTYPNQITREGVLGEEYAKFSTRLTPEHDVTLPFTRMLAGPMDYTPGGFLNRSRDKWKATGPTQVMGTRCHELAKFVVFDSPLTVACDAPEHYRGQPGIEFLRVVPTVWDETKILQGEVGEFILSARKSGANWFLGGMTNHTPRTLQIPLTFLGKGTFTAHLYADALDAAENAEHLVETTRTFTGKDTLTIPMAPDGGFAIQFSPK